MVDEKQKMIDLRDVIRILGKRKWFILIPFTLTVATAIGISFILTPEYESNTIVSYNNAPSLIKPLSGLVDEHSESRMTSEDRQRLLAAMRNEITSSRVLGRLISELKLDDDPQIEKAAQKTLSKNPGLDLRKVKLDLLIKALRDAITVEFAGQEQLEISVFDPDPFRAQEKADRLTDIYIEERILQDLGNVRQAQELTDEQLDKFEKRYQDLIDDKTNAEKQYLRLQIDESIISEENRRVIRTAIDEVASEITDLNQEEVALLEDLKGSVKLDSLSSNRLTALRTRLAENSRSLVDLMSKYVWSERVVLNGNIELNRKLLEMENEVAALVDQKFPALNPALRKQVTRFYIIKERVSFLNLHRGLLQESFSSVQKLATDIPVAKARLDQLEREVNAARQNLDLFKQQETSNQLRQDIIHSANARYQVIEPATIPLAPSKPNKPKIGAMGAILGLVLGGAAALIAELLDSSFRKVEDVEAELGLPVLATIPNIEVLQ